jgi:glycosidase
LGFVGAFPTLATGPRVPADHALLKIVPWLDHVVDLGASGIALGPIFASTSHGYDTVDHYRLDARLGTDDDFDELVGHAHHRGLRVQLDGVFNHVGREHRWVSSALRRGSGSEIAQWFHAAETAPLRLRTFEGHDCLVTLNHANPAVAEYVTGVMRYWLDRGADAWRLDAAYAVPIEFWAEVLPAVRRTHPEVWFEAEVLHGDYSEFVRDSTADTVTQYELWKAIWSSIEDRNFFELDWALSRHNRMLAEFAPATFIGNHDVTRIASRITDPRHLEHAIALLAVLGGTPTVYAGDEFAMQGIKEEREGGDDAVRPQFPASSPRGHGFPGEAIYRLHQRLIGLRRRHPWLHRATSTTLRLDNEQCLIRIASGDDRIDVALNLSDGRLPTDGFEAVLEADPASRTTLPHDVAPHGWAILSAGGHRS